MDHFPRLDVVWLIETEHLNFTPARTIASVIGGAVCVSPDGLLATAAHNLPQSVAQNCMVRQASENDFRLARIEEKFDHLDLAFVWVEKIDEDEIFACVAPSIDAEVGPMYGGELLFAYLHQQRLMFSRVGGTVAYQFPVLAPGAIPVDDLQSIENMLGPIVMFENADDAFNQTFPYRKAGHVYADGDEITHLHPALPVIQCHGLHVLRGASGAPVFKDSDFSCIGLIIFDKGGYDFLVPIVAVVAVLTLRNYARPDAGEFKKIDLTEFKEKKNQGTVGKNNRGTVGNKRMGTKGVQNPRSGKRGKANQGPFKGKNKAQSVAFYSEEGSNSLLDPYHAMVQQFDLGELDDMVFLSEEHDFAIGFPVIIESKDAESETDEFPEGSYPFKDVTSSELLRATIATVENSSENRPEHVDKTLRKSSVEHMTVNNVVSSSELKPEEYEIRMMFKCWE